MDFIIEALDAYEAAKAKEGWDGHPRCPRSGFSWRVGRRNDLRHCRASCISRSGPCVAGPALPPPKANRLYSSWVTDISIERLLDTTDLGKHGSPHVKSALCCNVLTEIVNAHPNSQGSVNVRGSDVATIIRSRSC